MNPYLSPVDVSDNKPDWTLLKRCLRFLAVMAIAFAVIASVGAWMSFRQSTGMSHQSPVEQVKRLFSDWRG